MDPKLKTGVLAGGIVTAIVVAVGVVVAIAAGGKDTGRKIAGNGGPPATSPREREQQEERQQHAAPKGPAERSMETSLASEIAAHPWWKVKPTEARVREIIGEMTELQANDVFELTPSGGSLRVPLEKENIPEGRRSVINTFGWQTKTPGSTYIYLDERHHSRRLTRLEAAQRLVAGLDAADFHRRK